MEFSAVLLILSGPKVGSVKDEVFRTGHNLMQNLVFVVNKENESVDFCLWNWVALQFLKFVDKLLS